MAKADCLSVTRVVVIGAGWAGLAAALALSRERSGLEVTVIERSRRAGGRAFSFQDPKSGRWLDNGQHVLLGCCSEFVACLQEIGMGDAVWFQPLLHIPVYRDGRWSWLSSRRWPGPLHLLPALLGYGHLSLRDRLRVLRLAVPLAIADTRKADEQSFADWLAAHGQRVDAIARLWELIGVAVLNACATEVSAGLAVQALRMGVMNGWQAARLGYFSRPLGFLADRAVRVLKDRGVRVMLGNGVRSVESERGKVVGVRLQDGTILPADAVIAAVPHDVLNRLLPGQNAAPTSMGTAAQLPWSPILNLYLLYDRPLMKGEVAAFADGFCQFVFNRGRLLGEDELDGRWLSVSISAADAYRSQAPERLIARADAELKQAFAGAGVGAARLVSAVPVWQTRATFLAKPGSWTKRPSYRGAISGLFLAGDWTDTGWPACLEGAVRSGRAAAEEMLLSMCIQEKRGIV
jgi:squalene-associated FAD-dependent desaturase